MAGDADSTTVDWLQRPQAEIESMQAERLRAMLALCAEGHPYYRQQWAEQGVDVASIRTLDDLQRLPLTPKQALMQAPESFRLNIPALPLHERVLWEVIYTTGTTSAARSSTSASHYNDEYNK